MAPLTLPSVHVRKPSDALRVNPYPFQHLSSHSLTHPPTPPLASLLTPHHFPTTSHPLPLQPHVRKAIDALRADPAKYDAFASDPQILGVLQKMRRMHSVSQVRLHSVSQVKGGGWGPGDPRWRAGSRFRFMGLRLWYGCPIGVLCIFVAGAAAPWRLTHLHTPEAEPPGNQPAAC